MLLWIDSGRLVAMVSVCPRYHSARTDLVMHVNTPSSPRAFKVIVLTQACRVFVCFPAHWLMMETSFLLARFLLTWPTESGRVCLPRAVPPDANQNERCSVFCSCFPRPNQTFFQTFDTPILLGFEVSNWSAKLTSSYPGDTHLITLQTMPKHLSHILLEQRCLTRGSPGGAMRPAAIFFNHDTKILHDGVGR